MLEQEPVHLPVEPPAETPDEPLIPAAPPHLGVGLGADLKEKLHLLLWNAGGQLESVYRAMVEHPGLTRTQLLPHTTCANTGALGNRRVIVNLLMDGVPAKAPTVARQAASTVNKLAKGTKDPDLQAHLAEALKTLQATADDPHGAEIEAAQLESESAILAAEMKNASGVYVYTYPHYWRHPYVPDTERRMLKIGRTSAQAWTRVLVQARQTGMPEDPLLLRVYKTADPSSVEKKFHVLLDAAEHSRSLGAAVGTEWFVTTMDFCDAVAGALELEVVKGSHDELLD